MKYVKLFEEFKEDKWWKKYTKYNLSAYPTNVPEDQVKIDLSGDIDTHPVMIWKSPKTGKTVYAYTKARMDSQKDIKYSRIENMTDEQIETLKVLCHDAIVGDDSDEMKQAAAVISIIAQTGLRPGSIEGFSRTENRGVSTLSKKNISINGSNIKMDFIGKSFKPNVAEINDGALAHYLEERLKNLSDEDFVFNVSKSYIETFYKKTLNMGKYKIKDLRTFVANKIAKYFLDNDPEMPPPVPEKPSEIKKVVKKKLQHAFEYVSQKLNNSPSMAKNSYVNPALIDSWLNHLGIKVSLEPVTEEEETIEPKEFIGNVPVYNLPRWWDSDEIELTKK